ncbi:hypothetical protein [Bacillus thuringiensis]|uniref:Uncharacterized protein n=1 Tax=Bacillus thuringiensis TaxID=1428 RepID=A0A9X6TI02_BACTU|nr:hypothetical protein [Bacillus thuringiensis]PEA86633.1 hypothetical protein CON71_28845 [Bacillus thuringiensis]
MKEAIKRFDAVSYKKIILINYGKVDQSHRANDLQIHLSCVIDDLYVEVIDIPVVYLQHISSFGRDYNTLTVNYVWKLNEKIIFNNLKLF